MSDDERFVRIDAALQRRAPLLWNDAGRPAEEPLPAVAEWAGEHSDDEIERELESLADVYPHGTALRGLGAEAIRERMLADPFRIPSVADREGYFSGGEVGYWLSGLADRLLVEAVAAERGRPLGPGQRLLDLGCASGRVLRHFLDLAPACELNGLDVGAHHVEWARRYLPPSLVVALGTTIPSLPYADASLDVVTAFSVLTHVVEFEETLLLELRRVLRPGGLALVTFHPTRVWDDLRDPDHVLRQVILGAHHRLEPSGVAPVTAETLAGPLPAERVVFRNLEWPVYNANVLHSEAWARERWGRILEVERILPRAHGAHQDAAVLTRRL